jgi:hypothetical protein
MLGAIWAVPALGAAGDIPSVVSDSTQYEMQSTVNIAKVSAEVQKSGSYEVLPLIDKANNGLAIGSSTKMTITWPTEDDAKSITHYDIHSSYYGTSGSFFKLNPNPINRPPYEVQLRRNGTFYFIVYRIDELGIPTQWTEIFTGVITDFNAVKDWALYD